MSYLLQSTFSRGELDPELTDRPDLELFRSGLAECENFVTLTRGGFRRRGGTRFNGEVKDSGAGARLIPFEFGEGQSYALEFGEKYFRVHTSAGRVGEVEVATPYSLPVLQSLQVAQSTDTLFIAGGGMRPHALKRLSETSWTIEPMEFTDGPYLPLNITPTSLRFGYRANPVPGMTSNTTPTGVVSSSEGLADAYRVFDGSDSKAVLAAGSEGWVGYQFDTPYIIDAYMLQAASDNSDTDDMPAQWALEASNDGLEWTILDTRDAESNWRSSEWRRFSFVNNTGYRHYRLRFRQGGGAKSDNSTIGQIVFHEAAANQTPFSMYASGTEGINGGAGFGDGDIGRHVRVQGSDGLWRWAKVESVVSATEAKVRLYGQALLDETAMTLWRLGSWSDQTGWPTSVGWHKNRLAFAGTDAEPTTIWESQTEDFANFAVSQPLVASDATNVSILSGQVNRVKWLVDDDDLLVGTSRAVRSVGKATQQDPYGPENIDQKPATNFGACEIYPVKIGSVLLYFGRYGTDLRELVYDFSSNGRLSQSISEVQSHLFSAGIKGACYQQYPSSVLWSRDAKGDAIGVTYEREQQVFGMHRHGFGGVVEDMISLEGESADDVWLIVRRTIGGQVRRYIEIMQVPFLRQNIEDAWHLDCALRYEGVAVSSVSGLWHLEGEDVVIFADGSDFYGTVAGGSIRIPGERKASKILVGLDVKARAKTLPPPINAQDGSAMGRKISLDLAYVSVFETGSLRMGADETFIDEQLQYRDGDQYDAPPPLITGRIDANVEVRWEDDGQLVFEVSGGKPATVLAVNMNVSTEP